MTVYTDRLVAERDALRTFVYQLAEQLSDVCSATCDCWACETHREAIQVLAGSYGPDADAIPLAPIDRKV